MCYALLVSSAARKLWQRQPTLMFKLVPEFTEKLKR